MLRITLRSFWAHKRRLVSTLVAIVLGVAFMAGTFVLSDTLDQSFDDLFAQYNEENDAQVQGTVIFDDPFGGTTARELLDPSLLDAVRGVEGVAEVVPFVITQGFGSSNRVIGKDGDPIGASQGPPTLLESWVANEQMNPYKLTDGRGPEGAGELALNVAAADDGDYEVGDTVPVVSQFGREDFTLVGIFSFGTAESAAGAVSAAITLDEAQRLAGSGERLQQIFVASEDGISQEEIVARIAPVLPDTAEVITGVEAAEQLSSDVQSGFQFFEIMLQVFGGIALLVGIFVISNTFSILVAQRTRELALLRAVGASRGQVLGSVLLEALLVGVLAAGLGLAAGILLAQGVTAAFEAFGADLPTDTLAIRPPTVVIALVVGIGVTIVAALSPAIRSMRVRPIAALRDVALDRSGASRARVVIGILVLALGLLNVSSAFTGAKDTDDLAPTGLGCTLIIVAAVIIGPVLAGPSIRTLGRGLLAAGRAWTVATGPIRRLLGGGDGPSRRRGSASITHRLASENAARSPKRTSATASALLISVALVGFITVFAASAQSSITNEVERGFEGDFVVQSSSGAFGPASGFSSQITDRVAEVDGVAAAVGLAFLRAEIEYPDGTAGQFLSAVDPAQLAGVLEPRMVEGGMDDLTDETVVLDVDEARDHEVGVGDTVTVIGPGGDRAELQVAAISDEENLLGYITISRATFERIVPQPVVALVFGAIDDGADLDRVLADVETAVADTPDLEALDRDGFIGDLASQITQFVTIIYVLLALSVVIALIGIGNTLSLSIHERTRELGLLRAVGMHRGQLRATIRWEAVLMSVLGTLVGLFLGLVLSRAVLAALSSSGLTEFTVPIGSLVTITVLAALLAVLASIRPSRRASRLAILDAIAHE